MLTPPEPLLELLTRLRLALPAQVRGMSRRVKRLARDLPAFESVWVDALAQARVLTAFQAAEINAGRGESLAVGPFVLEKPLESLAYTTFYQARDSRSGCVARLSVASIDPRHEAEIEAQCAALVRRAAGLNAPPLEPIEEFGLQAGQLWTAGRHTPGYSLAEWLVRHGRFSPAAVMEIARQMLAGLANLEKAGVLHGDLHARSVAVTTGGAVLLPSPGLRGVLRPAESYANADVAPDALDGIAPERIVDGTRPTTASDLYSLGTLWWQLLAGRAPLQGATGLAKLRNLQTAHIANIAEIAPDTPAPLIEAIAQCLQHNPQRRPSSFAELATRLATAKASSRQALAHAARRVTQRSMQLKHAPRLVWWQRTASRLTFAAGCVLIAVIVSWPQWGPGAAHSASSRLFSKPEPPALFSPESATALVSREQPATIRLTSATVESPSVVGPAIPTAFAPVAPQSSTADSGARAFPSDRPILANEIQLSAGGVVRGQHGHRLTIQVPDGGWIIDADDVRFENVDFVTSQADGARLDDGGARSLLRLNVRKTTFQGCSWTSTPSHGAIAAVSWYAAATGTETQSPPRQRRAVHFHQCCFQGMSAGLTIFGAGQIDVEATNTLYVGRGPFVFVDQPPSEDASLTLFISRVTLRLAAALVEFRCPKQDSRVGQIAILADDCALAPASDGALLTFTGDASPAALLEQLAWNGQGSVLVPPTPVAVWRGTDGVVRAIANEALQVDGVVRSELDFAGSSAAGPEASRVIRWQAPLRSSQPPGIRDDAPLLPGRYPAER